MKFSFRILLFLIPINVIVSIVSCDIKSDYPGYTKTKSGIHYKLLEIGDNETKAGMGDFVTINIAYRTMDDSVFFRGQRKIQIEEPTYKGSVNECFTMLAEGERSVFIISADSFFINTLNTGLPSFLPESSSFKVDVKLVEVQTGEEYLKEKEAFLSWVEDFGEYEKVILNQFIEQKDINVKPSGGMYQIILEEGTGVTAKQGDTVIVHYEGKFLNGKFFDSTRQRKEPFGFVLGQEWQVIEGMELAIGMMKEGGRSLFIMPSSLAFGKSGSSTGIIPPFTSLIFEVELLEVR
jgi:FKBP-type peptidyl-prolyl cis-trans isomerase